MSASVPIIRWHKNGSSSELEIKPKIPKAVDGATFSTPAEPFAIEKNDLKLENDIESKLNHLDEIQNKLKSMNDQLLAQQEVMLEQHNNIQQKQQEQLKAIEQSYRSEQEKFRHTRRLQDDATKRYNEEWSDQLRETFENVQSDFQSFLDDIVAIKQSVLSSRDEAKKRVKSLLHQISKVGRDYEEIQQVMNSSPIDALLNPKVKSLKSKKKKLDNEERQNENVSSSGPKQPEEVKKIEQPIQSSRKLESKFYQEALDHVKQFGCEAEEILNSALEPKKKTGDVVSDIIRNIVSTAEDDEESRRWPIKLEYFMSQEYLESIELEDGPRKIPLKAAPKSRAKPLTAKPVLKRRAPEPTKFIKPAPKATATRPKKDPKIMVKNPKPPIIKKAPVAKPAISRQQSSSIEQIQQGFEGEQPGLIVKDRPTTQEPARHYNQEDTTEAFHHLQVIPNEPPYVPFTIPSPSVSPISLRSRNFRAPIQLHQDPNNPKSPPKPPFPYNLQISDKPVFLRRTTVRPVTLSFLTSPTHVPKKVPSPIVRIKNDRVYKEYYSVPPAKLQEQQEEQTELVRTRSSLDIHDVIDHVPPSLDIPKRKKSTRNVKLQVSMKDPEPQVVERWSKQDKPPSKTLDTQTDDTKVSMISRGTDGMNPIVHSTRGVQHDTPEMYNQGSQTAKPNIQEIYIQTESIPSLEPAKPQLVNTSTSPLEDFGEETDEMEYSITKTIRRYHAVPETSEFATNTEATTYEERGVSPTPGPSFKSENTQTFGPQQIAKTVQTSIETGPEMVHSVMQTIEPLRTSQYSQSDPVKQQSLSLQTEDVVSQTRNEESQYSPPPQSHVGTQSESIAKPEYYDQIIQTYLDQVPDDDKNVKPQVEDASAQTMSQFLSIDEIKSPESPLQPQIIEVIKEKIVEVGKKPVPTHDEIIQTESVTSRNADMQTVEPTGKVDIIVGPNETIPNFEDYQAQTSNRGSPSLADNDTQTEAAALVEVGLDPIKSVGKMIDFITQTESIVMLEKGLETLLIEMKDSPLIQTDIVTIESEAVQTDPISKASVTMASVQTINQVQVQSSAMQTELISEPTIQQTAPKNHEQLLSNLLSDSWYHEILSEIMMDVLIGLLAVEIREEQTRMFWIEEEMETIPSRPLTPARISTSSQTAKSPTTRTFGVQTMEPKVSQTKQEHVLDLIQVQRNYISNIDEQDYASKAKVNIPVINRTAAVVNVVRGKSITAERVKGQEIVVETPLNPVVLQCLPSIPLEHPKEEILTNIAAKKEQVEEVEIPIPKSYNAIKQAEAKSPKAVVLSDSVSSYSSGTSSALSTQPSLGQLLEEMYSDGEYIHDDIEIPEISFQDIEQGEIVPPESFKKGTRYRNRSRSLHRMVEKLWQQVKEDDNQRESAKRTFNVSQGHRHRHHYHQHDPLISLEQEEQITTSEEGDEDNNGNDDDDYDKENSLHGSSDEAMSIGEIFYPFANPNNNNNTSRLHRQSGRRTRNPSAFIVVENRENEDEIDSLASSLFQSISSSADS